MSDRIELVEGIAPVADEWEQLARETGAGPFRRPGWFAAWLRAFGDGATPIVVCARRDGALTGAICVVRRRAALRSPTNWHTPAYGAVVRDDAAAAALAAALVDSAPATLDLAFLDPGEPFADWLLTAVREERRRVIARPIMRSPYVRIAGDFETYESGLDAKFRREARRRRRKLDEQGEVTVAWTDGSEDLARLLDEGFAVEGSGWKTERGTAIAQSEQTDRFYREVAAWAAGNGWLQLGFVRLDGRAIAFSYCIVVAGAVHVVKVGFDPDYRRYAPGTILTREAIARAFEQGLAVYDFLGNEDPYKLEWTSAVRERIRLQAFATSGLGIAGYAAWRYGRPVAKRAIGSVGGRERG